MALTEQHRNTLYQGLTQAVGDEEAVAAMLSQLPAGEDELATKSFVRSELSDQLAAQDRRIEERFATKDFVRAELSDQIAAQDRRMEEKFATKDLVRAEVGELRGDMNTGFAEIRTEMTERFADVETRMSEGFSDLKDHLHREMRQYMVWSYGALFVLLAAVVGAAKILQ